MSRELDEACARAMGLKSDSGRCGVCGWPLHDSIAEGCTPGYCSQRPPPAVRWDEPPPFSSNHAAARQLEDEIERRGLQDEYAYKLIIESSAYCEDRQTAFAWALLRATPEQRARAFLEAMRG